MDRKDNRDNQKRERTNQPQRDHTRQHEQTPGHSERELNCGRD